MRDSFLMDAEEAAIEPGVEMSEREKAALDRFRSERTIKRRILTPVVVITMKILMQRLNSMSTLNRAAFDEARSRGRALLTYSNHVSLFDDPWLTATFAGWSYDRIRWVAADALNFWSHPLAARFFSAGKGVPIVRGAGLNQMGMRFLEQKLAEGEWIHIFPEGGRSRNPMELRTPLKPGMAHMIRNTRPLVQAFHHRGMDNVRPIGGRFPKIGQKISLKFGEVVDSDEGLADGSPAEITAWAERKLLDLQESW